MSVFLYDPVKKQHVLMLKNGPWTGKLWSVKLGACDNPCCGCCHIDFKCIPEDAARDSQAEAVKFVLDVEKRSIWRAAGVKQAAPSDVVAEAVVKEMEDEDWKYLYQYLMGVKQEQIEHCDIRRLDADFPPDVLRGEATMVGYSEVFPLAAALDFYIGSELWLAVDDYCINPDCGCRKVMLQFVSRNDEGGLSGATIIDPPAGFYNYQTKSFEQVQAPGNRRPSLQELMSGLKDSRRGLNGELKKRHMRLKSLFKKALLKNDTLSIPDMPSPDSEFGLLPQKESEPMRATKIGRNDPCPCGSGKKFKKCCGA
jgi:hypothetical protein